MTTPQLLEQNTKVSFARAKEDIYTLYTYMNKLRNDVDVLNQKNMEMALQIKRLNLELQISKIKKKDMKEVAVQKVISTEKKPELVGSMLADKVHNPKCIFAKNIKKVNKIKFDSKQEAFRQGYTVCSCLNLF